MTPRAVGQLEHARELVLVRHAQTHLNVEQRLRGRADPPLSEIGREQAASVAAAFDLVSPSVIITSPRRRAVETATMIAHRQGVAVETDARLDDIDYGKWTGMAVPELRAQWPVLFDRYLHCPNEVSFPNGESVLDAQARAWELIRDLASTERLERIALVTHDAIIKLIVCRVLGAPLSAIHHLAVDLVSTTGLGVRDHELAIDWFNDRPDHGHLS
ncbi:MAG TPA: histidine phosphatase family protein [Kofleriaceae bacterium]|jgi:broad specificity phosphatase PhoE